MIKTRLAVVYFLMLFLVACGDDKAGNGSDNKSNENDTTSIDSIEVDTLLVDTSAITDSIVPKEVPGQEDKAQAATVSRKTYNLKEYTNDIYNISIDLPVGSKFDFDPDLEELTITFGRDFALLVGEQFESIAEIKSKMKNTMHNQHLGYIVDETQGFVKTSKANGIETHSLFYSVNDGRIDILINTIPSQTFSKTEIMELWKACKTIKASTSN